MLLLFYLNLLFLLSSIFKWILIYLLFYFSLNYVTGTPIGCSQVKVPENEYVALLQCFSVILLRSRMRVVNYYDILSGIKHNYFALVEYVCMRMFTFFQRPNTKEGILVLVSLFVLYMEFVIYFTVFARIRLYIHVCQVTLQQKQYIMP